MRYRIGVLSDLTQWPSLRITALVVVHAEIINQFSNYSINQSMYRNNAWNAQLDVIHTIERDWVVRFHTNLKQIVLNTVTLHRNYRNTLITNDVCISLKTCTLNAMLFAPEPGQI